MKPKSRLIAALAQGDSHRDYSCACCGWAEDAAELELCVECESRLVCRECRGFGLSERCFHCGEFDLPEAVQMVGCHDNRDVQFTVSTWVGGPWIASHYYVRAEVPSCWRYGRLDLAELCGRVNLRTEKPQLIPKYINRLLRVMVGRHRAAIRKRKGKALLIYIDHKDTVCRLIEQQLNKTLDGG